MSGPEVYGPESITLEGRQGARYWVRHPFEVTGRPDVDGALSSYPLAVFQPHGRDPAMTPVLIGLQGIAAPFQWNAFLVPTLLDMGVACVLFDAPLAGERSLIRHAPGDVLQQLLALAERGVGFRTGTMVALMEMAARDVSRVVALLRDRRGLGCDRLALFGVSLGCLIAGLAFARDGVGRRLLCVIGHADLRMFASSYDPFFTPLAASWPVRWAAEPLSRFWGKFPIAARDFLVVLDEARGAGGPAAVADPMTYVGRVGVGRPARFLLGQHDPMVRLGDGRACAARFPDGRTFEHERLRHGQTTDSSSFAEHVRYFVGEQLKDWRW